MGKISNRLHNLIILIPYRGEGRRICSPIQSDLECHVFNTVKNISNVVDNKTPIIYILLELGYSNNLHLHLKFIINLKFNIFQFINAKF